MEAGAFGKPFAPLHITTTTHRERDRSSTRKGVKERREEEGGRQDGRCGSRAGGGSKKHMQGGCLREAMGPANP